MSVCRECPSPLPPEPPDLHPSFRRVLCDDCRRCSRRRRRREARGPLPAPAPRPRKAGPAKLPGSSTQRVLRRKREYVDSLKVGPCQDCGLSFPPVCMDFDHRPAEAKVREISRCKTRAAVDAEVAKCDLVCANCHRLRTEARRLSSLGTAGGPSDTA